MEKYDEKTSAIEVVYLKAIMVILETGTVSSLYIQKKLRIGYSKVISIIEWMETNEFISSMDENGNREIYITPEEYSKKFAYIVKTTEKGIYNPFIHKVSSILGNHIEEKPLKSGKDFKHFTVENGILTKYIEKVDGEVLTDVVIPDVVVEIGKKAFALCKTIRRVVVPSCIKKIGDLAFAMCNSLEVVNLSNGLTCIGVAAFYDCTLLQKIEIPASVLSIGSIAFLGCFSILNIKLSSIKAIRRRTFENCIRLQSITIPSSVETIGEDSFYHCNALDKVVFEDVSGWCVENGKGEIIEENIKVDNSSYNPFMISSRIVGCDKNYGGYAWKKKQ